MLVVTARDAVSDRVALLDAGADDYLTKPLQLAELIARIRALIRRAANHVRPTIEIGDVVVDPASRTVRRAGSPVALSPKEFALVEYLALHRGELVTRTRIFEHIYDEHEDTRSQRAGRLRIQHPPQAGQGLRHDAPWRGYIVDA